MDSNEHISPCPVWDETAAGASVSLRVGEVYVYVSGNREARASETFARDGAEFDRLLAWIEARREELSYVTLSLHEAEPTHEPLVDRLRAVGWHVHFTRYLFPGSRSQERDGIWAHIWIGGAGWVRGDFGVGDETVSLWASSVLDNGWQELLDVLAELLSGSATAEASWWEEPYYARFRFARVDQDRAQLVIVREDFDESVDDVTEQVLIDASVSVTALAAGVAESSRALLDAHPHHELGEAWRTEAFLPIDSLVVLERALASRRAV